MTNQDVDRIENTLGVTLPELYKKWLLRLPPTLPDDEDHSEEGIFMWFVNNADLLIERNLKYRKSGYCGLTWPDNLFAIWSVEQVGFIDLEQPDALFQTDPDAGPYYDPLDYESCRIGELSSLFTGPESKFLAEEG